VPVVFAAKNDPELKFLLESLKKFKNFNKSSVNESWVFNRFAQWKEERGSNNVQLHDMSDAESFLKPFYSQSSSKFWTKQYADAIYEALPDNSAKQITVWNPGCGDGYEAFSLACLLKKRYPNAKIKIYAHDNDLIVISSAPLLQIPQSDAEGWYKPFLSKTVEGNVIFSPEIRDSVLFEYHDCTHMNAIPPVDIIFSRDLLSFVQAESLDHVCLDFYEKIKENGIVMLGDNEVFSDHQKWLEKTYGSVIVYNKQ
ncbi:MAG: CheR family methyltransferase, partial [Spirochaetales bacterium]